ncbi:MAG TPA: antitoxin family protein [Kofleriaceae bacterium]|jgi:predicted DNA-binding antitoxin AbrB/MazE fold protein|nr:antitoxin family protein [Kofleriaceae bacterium]
MAAVEAEYDNGVLRPMTPLRLQLGERVHLIVKRRPDTSRWNLARLAGANDEDVQLASAGLDDWAQMLAGEDHR